MTAVHIDPGLYTNVFHVQVPEEADVMVAPSSAHPALKAFRDMIKAKSWHVRVYRADDQIFGYGPEMNVLKNHFFQDQRIRLRDQPKLCARCILEGLGDQLKENGYRELSGKGRTTFYEPRPYRLAGQDKLRIYRGYDLRTIFWRQGEELLFGLVVDIRWQIEDAASKRLSPAEIAQYGAMREFAQIQDELLPTGRINTEVSRLRLQQHLLPFVNEYKSFPLPCGGTARLNTTPIRVILGG